MFAASDLTMIVARLLPLLLLQMTALGAEVATVPTKLPEPWSFFPSNKILTTGEHWLNEFAREVEAKYAGMPVIFSDELLSASFARAGYLAKVHALILPESAATDSKLIPLILHELIHARYGLMLRQNASMSFMGYVLNVDPKKPGMGYGAGYSLDEIPATHFSLVDEAQTARALLASGGDFADSAALKKLKESLGFLRHYSNSLTIMLGLLDRGLGDMTSIRTVQAPSAADHLPKSIQWTETSADHVTITLPKSDLPSSVSRIRKFSQNSAPLLKQIFAESDALAKEFKLSDSKRVHDLIASVEKIDKEFRTTFPEDALLIEGIGRDVSIGREHFRLRSFLGSGGTAGQCDVLWKKVLGSQM